MDNPIPEEQNIGETKNFLRLIQSQNYEELKKQKDRWTDELFYPGEKSIYKAKAEVDNSLTPSIPKFLKVNYLTKLLG